MRISGLSRGRAAVLLAVTVMAAGLAAAETWARFFLHNRYHGKDPREFYYPRIARMKAMSIHRDTLSIGIFGSSVTATPYITRCIREKTQTATGMPVEVYNLSLIGGSTGDAAFMYKWLDAEHFHAVVLHGGIGEMRMNRRLREVRTPYKNLTWFRRRLDVERYYSSYFKLPCAVAYMWTSRLEKLGRIYTQWNYEAFRADFHCRNFHSSGRPYLVYPIWESVQIQCFGSRYVSKNIWID